MHTVKIQVSVSMLWSAVLMEIFQIVRILLSICWVSTLKESYLYPALESQAGGGYTAHSEEIFRERGI